MVIAKAICAGRRGDGGMGRMARHWMEGKALDELPAVQSGRQNRVRVHVGRGGVRILWPLSCQIGSGRLASA